MIYRTQGKHANYYTTDGVIMTMTALPSFRNLCSYIGIYFSIPNKEKLVESKNLIFIHYSKISIAFSFHMLNDVVSEEKFSLNKYILNSSDFLYSNKKIYFLVCCA